VIPANDGADVGVVTVTTGVNFKTSISSVQPSVDMSELYINETYSFNLEFENVGDQDCPSPAYTIVTPNGLNITGNTQGVLGTIEPSVRKSVPISVRCFEVEGDYEYKKINITIRDATGKTWEDSVSLRFYKETIDFSIKAEDSISGVVISPDAKTYSFTNITNGTVSAPLRKSGDYLVVFSGATIETETRYALGIGVEAEGDFGAFFDTSVYEPNNTEGTTVAISEQRIMAYLDKNDIDYYRVSYNNVQFPSQSIDKPANVTASITEDYKVAVSWDVVSGAGSYNIYRAESREGAYTKVGTTASPSYIDTVAAMRNYYYKVSAVDADGVGSAYSASVSITSIVEIDVAALADALSWISANAESARQYILTLGKDETIAGQTLTYAGKTDITVMLKGRGGERSVSLSDNGSLFTVGDGVTLVVDEGVTLKGYSDNNASLVRVDAGGTLLLKDDAKITGNTTSSYGGGVYVGSDGRFEMSGGTISGNAASDYGGGVYVGSNGRFELSGGTISGNAATDHGGGVYVGSDGRFTMSGGTISGNAASTEGGGVYVGNNGRFTMSGGTISGNAASTEGGGVYVGNNGRFELSGGEISGNSASSSSSSTWGGGVFVDSSGRFELSGGTISGNRATEGGGVYVYKGTFEMSGGTISGNTATYGGGVFVYNGRFEMSGGTISSNTARSSYGGGVYVDSSGTFTMSNGTIRGNSAIIGGGVFVNRGTFEMSGGAISGNRATSSSSATGGGGVLVYSGRFEMSGGTISGNTASSSSSYSDGGGVYVEEGTFEMSGGTISGNTASASDSSGGGVYVYKGTFIKQSGGVIYGSDANDSLKNTARSGDRYGHAVYVYSGSKKRNTTAGVGVTLNSGRSGSAGGWEG
jgi:parallel beta-helix repeat protein